MEITMNQTMTSSSTHNPCSTSGFGMPTSARGQYAAFGAAVWIDATGLEITGASLRDRKDLAAKGHVSLDAVVPGNRAWSPPLC